MVAAKVRSGTITSSPGPTPKSDKRQMQGDGAVGNGDAVPDPHEGG